eukprot:TRINITY_DN7167_c0_g1_i1.p1 TRINITY_DN7167_c0_g1~~TRINITY_DN7167_c0_g1_i1.p1  ORF type:complete len:648 (-),score=201.49 TRINITY_DN7167_c0_g1_i1:46-1989(-)
MAAFEEFGVMPEIIRGLTELGWQLPRDIQAESIPLILGGGDVMAAAETGSGKTGAFAIPTLQIIHEIFRDEAKPKAQDPQPKDEVLTEAYAAISKVDRESSVAVSDDGLTVQSRDAENWGGARANVSISSGKYYFEMLVEDEGTARVGWCTKSAKLNLGTDQTGFGYGGFGKRGHNRKFEDYGEPYGKGDTIGCYLDRTGNTIHYSKNGKVFGPAFQLPTALRQALYPAVCLKNCQVTLNFGGTPFKHDPQGYSGFNDVAPETASTVAPNKKSKVTGVHLPRALIFEPTRDLAVQTYDAIETFQKYLTPKLSAMSAVGGSPVDAQLKKLEQGVDIVVGSIDRIDDLIHRGGLDLSMVKLFILDEADAIIESHRSGIMKIFNAIPKENNIQVLMFSATLHSEKVAKMGQDICVFPTWVDLKGKDAIPDTVDYGFVWADPQKIKDWVHPQIKFKSDGIHAKDNTGNQLKSPEGYSEAIKQLKPILLVKIIESLKMDQAMIFCRTKQDCDNLQSYFGSMGAQKGPMAGKEFSSVCLHSDKSQKEKQMNLQAFKDGEVRFLICTDIAARGIDVSGLPYMINYTLPDKTEDFIHRIGRVGRSDRMGLAISLVGSNEEKVWYHTCPSKGKNCSDARYFQVENFKLKIKVENIS